MPPRDLAHRPNPGRCLDAEQQSPADTRSPVKNASTDQPQARPQQDEAAPANKPPSTPAGAAPPNQEALPSWPFPSPRGAPTPATATPATPPATPTTLRRMGTRSSTESPRRCDCSA